MTGPVALSAPVVIGLAAAAVIGGAFVVGLVALSLRGRPRRPDIPPAMQPGPPDEVLERSQLERIMGWGVVFVLFFATWLPVYWFQEPNTNVSDEKDLIARSIARGEKWFAEFSEENPTGFGCARCHGPEGSGGQQISYVDEQSGRIGFQQEPSLNDVCGRLTVEDIRTTIEQGRDTATVDMPSWSVRFAGAMNDQQITDLINYLVSIQTVKGKANLCTHPPLPGEAEEEAEES